jgi:Pyruvate/2-oxoacid:ferredoxin oxidoreductase delta subunit
MMLDEEEMTLLVHTPGTTASVAHAVGRGIDEVDGLLRSLFMRGTVFIGSYDQGEPVWGLIDHGRFMDSVLFDPRYDVLGDEFFDLWKEFTEKEFLPDFPPVEALRVLPVEEVLRSTRILDLDRVRTIVRGARRLAVQRCPCRVRERRCDAPRETCLSLDTLADYTLKRGLGREIGVDEALDILTRSEELGLVHQSTNSDTVDVICNCCPCCCAILRSVIAHGKATAAVASRFRPLVDEDRCVDCLDCVMACHFSAMVERDGRRFFDADKCYGCGLCARACPEEAIELREFYPPSHVHPNPPFTPSLLPPEDRR